LIELYVSSLSLPRDVIQFRCKLTSLSYPSSASLGVFSIPPSAILVFPLNPFSTTNESYESHYDNRYNPQSHDKPATSVDGGLGSSSPSKILKIPKTSYGRNSNMSKAIQKVGLDMDKDSKLSINGVLRVRNTPYSFPS